MQIVYFSGTAMLVHAAGGLLAFVLLGPAMFAFIDFPKPRRLAGVFWTVCSVIVMWGAFFITHYYQL